MIVLLVEITIAASKKYSFSFWWLEDQPVADSLSSISDNIVVLGRHREKPSESKQQS